MTAFRWLNLLGVPTDCISPASAAEESSRRFVIKPQQGDQIWRVKVDGCWLRSKAGKRVDYLFWGQSASGKRMVLLVELKGKNFGQALAQIESTLQYLCKRADGQGIHQGQHKDSPGHESSSEGGVRAFAVLSKGKGVPQRQREREQIRHRYGILVYPKSQRLEVGGLDGLPGS